MQNSTVGSVVNNIDAIHVGLLSGNALRSVFMSWPVHSLKSLISLSFCVIFCSFLRQMPV